MADFALTDRQREGQRILTGSATHILLEGGSRSGKTFLFLRAIAARAARASGSSHAVLRHHFNHLKASIIADTWPKMLDLCFSSLARTVRDDRSDWFTEFPNGARVWWGGLDDKQRAEKILGQEHSTIYLNECSQIGFDARTLAVTRLAQSVDIDSGPSSGQKLPLRMYYDANPPGKGHWLYRLFHEHVNPVSKRNLTNPENYARLLMNPADNAANLPPEYLVELENLPERERKRFLLGLYSEENPNALFSPDWFERWRVWDGNGSLPKMQRVVVAVDPSGADEEHPEADAIGIVVAGLGQDGNGYLLEDLTVHASPAVWGKIAAVAVRRHNGDCVVGERNFGGAMVKHTVQVAQRELNVVTRYKEVTASRGKHVRAEPLSALYEKGHIRHVGMFPELEDEYLGFSTTGYRGERSPNRADATVFAFAELFPAIAMHRSDGPNFVLPADDGYVFEHDDYGVDLARIA